MIILVLVCEAYTFDNNDRFAVRITSSEIFYGASPGGGSPLYKLYRYVWRQRVRFLSLFGLK